MSIIEITTFGLFLSDRRQDSAISFVAWIVVGLLTGFIGSKLLNKTRHGFLRDVLLGVVGAIVGGFLANLFRDAGVASLSFYNLFVAFAGAVAFLIIYHARSIVGTVRRGRL